MDTGGGRRRTGRKTVSRSWDAEPTRGLEELRESVIAGLVAKKSADVSPAQTSPYIPEKVCVCERSKVSENAYFKTKWEGEEKPVSGFDLHHVAGWTF